MHKDWCGKPCSDCTNPCRLDESIACSPDCEFLGENGEHNHPECQECDALPLYRILISIVATFMMLHTKNQCEVMCMKIAIEVVNGKVTAVHSDYNGEVEVKIYEDLDTSKMTDEELDALDDEVASVSNLLYYKPCTK